MENGGINPFGDLGNLLDFKKISNFLGINNNSRNNNPLYRLMNMGKNNNSRNYRYKVYVLPIEEAYRRIKQGSILVIDVRTQMEYNTIRIKGSINIPLDKLSQEIGYIVKDKNEKILLYCSTGSRVRRAIQILNNMGYINLNIWEGGGLNTFAFEDLIVYNERVIKNYDNNEMDNNITKEV